MAAQTATGASWWVIIPQGDQTQSDSYKEQVDFRVQFTPGTPQYSALQNRQSVSYDGVTWVYWKGPFATEAQAQAAQNPQPAPSPKEAAGRAIGAAVNDTGLGAIADFFSRLTQKNTWVRVGEVIVGVILLGIGVNAMFAGKPMRVVTGAAGAVGKVVP